ILPSGRKLASKEVFAEEFFPRFTKDPVSFLLNCEGAFVFAFYDAVSKTLSLVSDPFGNIALYYSKQGNSFRFSSSQKEVATTSNAPINESAIRSYLRIGFPLNTDTFFEGVHRLPVATLLRMSQNGNTELHKYFFPSYKRSD